MKYYILSTTIFFWSDDVELLSIVKKLSDSLQLNIFVQNAYPDFMSIPYFFAIIDGKNLDQDTVEIMGQLLEGQNQEEVSILIIGNSKTQLPVSIKKCFIKTSEIITYKWLRNSILKKELNQKINPMEYVFCSLENNDLLEQISLTFANNLFTDFSKDLIQLRYKEMIENFGKKVCCWNKIRAKDYEYNQFGDLCLPVSKINDSSLSGLKNIGIDLPTWFGFSESQKRIMIVGMEPLRIDNSEGNVTISSPFALHLPSNKKNSSRSLVYKFIRELLVDRRFVYLTDISKIYGLRNGKKYTGEVSLSNQIFLEELNHIQPEYILVFGKSALERINSFYALNSSAFQPIRIIRLTHPAAWGGNKKYFDSFQKEISN